MTQRFELLNTDQIMTIDDKIESIEGKIWLCNCNRHDPLSIPHTETERNRKNTK